MTYLFRSNRFELSESSHSAPRTDGADEDEDEDEDAGGSCGKERTHSEEKATQSISKAPPACRGRVLAEAVGGAE